MIGYLEGVDDCYLRVALNTDFKVILSKIQNRYGRIDLTKGMYVPLGKLPLVKGKKVRFDISLSKCIYKILPPTPNGETRIQICLPVIPSRKNSLFFSPDKQHYMVLGEINGKKHTQAFMSDLRSVAEKAKNY